MFDENEIKKSRKYISEEGVVITEVMEIRSTLCLPIHRTRDELGRGRGAVDREK